MVGSACSEKDEAECNSSAKNVSFKPCTRIFCVCFLFCLFKKDDNKQLPSCSKGYATVKVEGSKML